jgi:Zn-dependent protease
MARDWRPGGVARGARRAFRPSWVFITLTALFVASGVATWQRFGIIELDVLVFVVTGWLVTLSLHEYAHALTAYRAGDLGVADRGYLTLNLLKYSHPLLSIILPVVILLLGGIGLPGGAVWVDRHLVRTKAQDSLISAAGPAVNVVFTLLLTVPFLIGVNIAGHVEFWAAVAFLAFLQLTASVLNLIPMPGLDGGNLLYPWLSDTWRRRYDLMAPYGMLLLFVLLFEPRVNRIFFDTVYSIAEVIGLPPILVSVGANLFQFWR